MSWWMKVDPDQGSCIASLFLLFSFLCNQPRAIALFLPLSWLLARIAQDGQMNGLSFLCSHCFFASPVAIATVANLDRRTRRSTGLSWLHRCSFETRVSNFARKGQKIRPWSLASYMSGTLLECFVYALINILQPQGQENGTGAGTRHHCSTPCHASLKHTSHELYMFSTHSLGSVL